MYTVYKTTNLVNGKFYIGVHKTNNPHDDYLGSGKLLKRAIEKYGVENFKKEIVALAEDADTAFLKEAELVTREMVDSDLCYNLKLGGEGGFDYINSKEGLNNTSTTSENKRIGGLAFMKKYGKMPRPKEPYPYSFKGKQHKEESKKKMSVAASKRTGKKNSQFGTMWITNGSENRKIKKTASIPEGWRRGRTKQSVRKSVVDTLVWNREAVGSNPTVQTK